MLFKQTRREKGYRWSKICQAWAVLEIPPEFSTYFPRRLSRDPKAMNLSTIFVSADLSNYEIGLMVVQKVEKSFSDTIDFCLNFTASPIVFTNPPVYGSTTIKFSSFLAPGIITTAIFAHSIGLTAIAFIRERMEATMDRISAAGVSSTTFIVAHFFAHLMTLVIQCAVLLLTTVFIVKIEIIGLIIHVVLILIILGSSGMALGLVISSLANKESEAIQVAMAAFFPALLLSGILWPIEAVSTSLYQVGYLG